LKIRFPVLDLKQLFPFDLDSFQLQAIDALNHGKSVVVCAPTGSGKTLIGEYAIYRALSENKRVFYTTPLKALSNQKFRDFRDQFGLDQVGLLTGDISINRDAAIVVMTTEIFRNMLYGTEIGDTGTSLQAVQAIILDECHYMNDRQRGTVWEESIIYCPKNIQLVGLSATVANGEQLTDWIDQIHGATELIYSDFRPVPLDFHFCTLNGLFPLLNELRTAIHPRLKTRRKPPQEQKGQKKKAKVPSITSTVSHLQQRDMLPAIYFIFSRKGCDKAVQEVSGLSLVTLEEEFRLRSRIDAFVAANPEAIRTGHLEPLYRGIAAHHAGILPAWKSLVEELFQQGLIKVVFATETLAAGINMPARTTVISSLSKRTDSGHRLLNASEFLQMAGRAGRRGMDALGHVVTVESPFEGSKEASALALSKPDPLVSQFAPSYGMVLNLLQKHSLEEARELVERSFGQYLSTIHLSPQQSAIAELTQAVTSVQTQLAQVDVAMLNDYAKLQGRYKEEQRLLKILQQQAEESLSGDLRVAASFAVAGTILSIRGRHEADGRFQSTVLVTKLPGSGQFPYLVCLSQDNQWSVVTPKDVFRLHQEFGRLAAVDTLLPPKTLVPRPGSILVGGEESLPIAQQIPVLPTLEALAPEVKAQQQQVDAVADLLDQHPASRLNNPNRLLKQQQQLEQWQAELCDRKAKYDQFSHRYWQEFVNLMTVLEAFDCLADNKPTATGQMAAAIRGDNELWLTLALTSGELDGLAPQEFAAACAAIVTEAARPDSWVRYRTSDAVEDALEGLRSTRRQIFQQQRRHQVVMPVWLEWDLIALVEQWALETDWSELCNNTSLDEGDVVRLLRRTLDFLSQIPYVPFLSEEVKTTARQAAYLINRFPVNEGLGD
jgi:superfamily II RNA helicase